MSERGKILLTIGIAIAICIIMVVAVRIGVLKRYGDNSDSMIIYSRYIPVEGFRYEENSSYLVFDVNTDLVYVILYDYKRMAISPYYIVDESNTQRIAVYPQDLDYLIKEEIK